MEYRKRIQTKPLFYYVTCDALRNLVPFVQFKNPKENNEEVLLLVKLHAKWSNTLKQLVGKTFSRFLNCANSTKCENKNVISGIVLPEA